MTCAKNRPVFLSPGGIIELEESVYGKAGSRHHFCGKRKSVFQILSGGTNGFAKLLVLGSIGTNALPSGIEVSRPIANLVSGNDITSEINQQAMALCGGNEDLQNFFRNGGEIRHNQGSAGGYLVGRKHSEGGIKGINKATGQPLEVEGGEVIITAPAVQDNTKREFEGQQLTNRQILSKINVSGGGVSFADGGAVSSCRCTGKAYRYGGETLSDYQIVDRINRK
jgi:hypothetical protein